MHEVRPVSATSMHLYAFLLAGAGFFFGVTFAMFNTFFAVIKTRFHGINESNQETVVDNLNFYCVVGCTVACLASAPLYQNLGRYRSLLAVGGMEVLATLLVLFNSLPLLYLLRFLHGFAACYWLVLTPMMLRENLTPALANVYNPVLSTLLCVGMLVAYIFGVDWLRPYWRLVLLWPLFVEVPRLALLAAFFPMESPQWLAEQAAPAAAIAANYTVLYAPRDAEILADELLRRRDLSMDVKEDLLQSIRAPGNRRQVIVCLVMNIASTLSFNALLNLQSTEIFKQLKPEHALAEGLFDKPENMTIFMGFWNVLSCLSLIAVLPRLGKYKAMILGMVGLVASYSFFIFGIHLKNKALVMIGTNMFASSYTYSLGGVLFPYSVEIVPAPVMSLCAFLQWTLTCFVAKFGNKLIATFSAYRVFAFAQMFCLASTAVFVGMAVEIEGKSSEQIKADFNKKSFLE